ncbi:NUDIX domain-containing protein [Kitasatospora sp. NPDC059646]|uniref:NUDIX domain-containing protein n=1 Tax=Kitasatospora sp. NPDC059646 TaxID=3346893 RepID=UPI00368CCC63
MAHSDIPNNAHPRRRAGCLGIARDETGRVLLVRTLYGKGLILPGGGANEDEPFDEAVRREFAEETGLHVRLWALVAVDQVPANPVTGSCEGVNFVFDAGEFTEQQKAGMRVPSGAVSEIAGFEWLHPDELATHPEVSDGTARRIAQALDAMKHGMWLPLLHEGRPAPAAA